MNFTPSPTKSPPLKTCLRFVRFLQRDCSIFAYIIDPTLARCPNHAPFQTFAGHYCCVHETREEHDICQPLTTDDFVPCSLPPCKTTMEKLIAPPRSTCPIEYPFSHHRGQFCCKDSLASLPGCSNGGVNDDVPKDCCLENARIPCPGRSCKDNSKQVCENCYLLLI